MATATGWAYYYKIRTNNDHMDTLRLYKGYKSYWDKHRIPGETKINEVLWEDTWWKVNSPFSIPRKLPPLKKRKKRSEYVTASSLDSTTLRAPPNTAPIQQLKNYRTLESHNETRKSKQGLLLPSIGAAREEPRDNL